MTAQIGLVSMGIASVDDVLAWTVLAIATSYHGGGNPEDGAWGILIGFAWVLFLVVVVRRGLIFLKNVLSANSFVVTIFLGMCISAWFTQILGLHAFFGGFIFGIAVPKDDQEFIHKFIEQLEVIVVNFFVPLFFANTGLKTDFRVLNGSAGPVLIVLVCAIGGKMLPPFLLGKCRGYSWRFSFQLASLMNCRGLMELIALEVAQTVGVFNMQMKSVFVVMALVTTFMSGPMFRLSYRADLDPPQEWEAEKKAKKRGNWRNKKSEQAAKAETEKKEAQELKPKPIDEEDGRRDSLCREIPPEAQLESSSTYGYLFHGTVNPKISQSTQRKSLADVFGLSFRKKPNDDDSTDLPTRMQPNTELGTPRFDMLRTDSFPAHEPNPVSPPPHTRQFTDTDLPEGEEEYPPESHPESQPAEAQLVPPAAQPVPPAEPVVRLHESAPQSVNDEIPR